MNEWYKIRVCASEEEKKKENDSKTESAKENLIVFPDILRVVLHTFNIREVDGISSPNGRDQLCICYG